MDTLTGRLGPREAALAIAFGILLGLLPKDNLLFVVVAVLFFLSHANILIGLAATVVVSFFAPWIHELLAHPIGYLVLTSPFGQNTIGALYRIPLIPWTMLNETIVLGSFLMGAALFFPVYFLLWVPLKISWPKKELASEGVATEKERKT